jgi:hypothetical protein
MTDTLPPPASRTPARSAPLSRSDPVVVPDDGHLAATAAHPTPQSQSHEPAFTLPARDQRRQIQKHVPPARPAERAQAIAVRVKLRQGVDRDGHVRR